MGTESERIGRLAGPCHGTLFAIKTCTFIVIALFIFIVIRSYFTDSIYFCAHCIATAQNHTHTHTHTHIERNKALARYTIGVEPFDRTFARF